jgi:transposase-like protein
MIAMQNCTPSESWKETWTVLRTANPIERLNKEFKRRTQAMEVPGPKSQSTAAWRK